MGATTGGTECDDDTNLLNSLSKPLVLVDTKAATFSVVHATVDVPAGCDDTDVSAGCDDTDVSASCKETDVSAGSDDTGVCWS